jgi:hypothetical protein
MTPRSPSTWADSFPFEKGDLFEVEGPFGYGGSGRVLRRTDDVLAFELQMPAKRVLMKKIPELQVTLTLTAAKDGAGNHAEGTFARGGEAGEVFADSNVVVKTDAANRSREIRSSIKVGGQALEISISQESAEKVKLRINGYKFTLLRSKKR